MQNHKIAKYFLTAGLNKLLKYQPGCCLVEGTLRKQSLQSQWSSISKKAPQGCVLGPMPFNIYISGFSSGIEGMFVKVKDDTEL